MPGKNNKGTELADRMELVKKHALPILLQRRRDVKKMAGSRPYGAEANTDNSQLMGVVGKLRADTAYGHEFLNRYGQRDADGTVYLPKELLAKLRETEAKLREGVVT